MSDGRFKITKTLRKKYDKAWVQERIDSLKEAGLIAVDTPFDFTWEIIFLDLAGWKFNGMLAKDYYDGMYK